MSNLPGLHVIGEANFSDHGANRLGASALMQGLADGYFILPYTIGAYLAGLSREKRPGTDHPEFRKVEDEVRERTRRLLSIEGERTVQSIHKDLGKLMWDNAGMARNKKGLEDAIAKIPELREEFWKNVRVPGSGEQLNQELEKAGRLADFLEFGELLCRDALDREESCGGHFREEHQTEEGEALRNDDDYSYVSAWEFQGADRDPVLHKEPLEYEEVKMATRSYK